LGSGSGGGGPGRDGGVCAAGGRAAGCPKSDVAPTTHKTRAELTDNVFMVI